MTDTPRFSRRSFCAAVGSLPLLSACGTRQNTGFRPQPSRGARQVALLVPLSGPRAPLGQKMAKAVWLSEDLGALGPRAAVIDSGGDADTAKDAAARAVAEGADIIVGPLFRDQTVAVLKVAEDVPVVSLSNDDALAAAGAWVFGVTPAQSVDAVLRYSKETGAQRIAMLETPGALGERARATLAKGAPAAKASVLPTVPRGIPPAEMGAALRQAGGGALPDILFVPSTASPALDQAVAAVGTGVTTIGSLQWSGLPATRLAQLDKACFTGPDPQRFDRLSASFHAQLDEDMGVLGALAVDAVAFAKSVDAPKRLARSSPLDGLLGTTGFRPDRTCTRALYILRIDGGGVVRVA